MQWILLILSLPTENATVRMRAWRAIKALGAASLRDGVYVLPEISDHGENLNAIAEDVRVSGGTAHVLYSNTVETEAFPALFDRSEDYVALEMARLAPARISAMALFSTNCRQDNDAQRVYREQVIRLAQQNGFRGVTRQFLSKFLSPRALADTSLVNGVLAMAANIDQV